MRSKPRIAVDAMGGDFGPRVNVPAALEAARNDIGIILVGDEAQIRDELSRSSHEGLDVHVVHASQVVGMDEKPSDALRRKKDSSIQVACRLVKEGQAEGVVSAGNSGAVVACGMFTIGRIPGIDRPALAGIIPTEKRPCVLIDVGANVDSKPYNLVQFAIMADVLARDVLGIPKPRVGLLSIGEEEGKGNSVVRETFDMLRRSSLNFIGNAEGRDIFTGNHDVVVCDGFVGNVALKLSEGLARSFAHLLKGELKRGIMSKIGTLLAMSAFSRFAKLVDYAEYGGAPLLGLKGSVIVCHGSSNVKAITNAVRMAATYTVNKAYQHIERDLAANDEVARFSRKTEKTEKTA